jgi:hypothetical protein
MALSFACGTSSTQPHGDPPDGNADAGAHVARADAGDAGMRSPHHDGGSPHVDGGAPDHAVDSAIAEGGMDVKSSSTDGGDRFGLLASGMRDRNVWPFASDSIWNMPIGSGATLLAAGITYAGSTIAYQDPEIIVMDPTGPLTDLDYSSVGWSGGDRCPATAPTNVLDQLPMPASFLVPSSTFNACAALLRADGHTVAQSNAFAHCTQGGAATCDTNAFPDQDIYGAGISGSHGGSQLSALGGTIRLGEFASGRIHHAMKLSVWAAQYYYCPSSPCRPIWPAATVDSYATPQTYGGTNPHLTEGALLALPTSFDLSTVTTAPGKILAQGLIDYGVYLVDDTSSDSWVLETEQGPAGDVPTEFETLYGYSIGTFAAPAGAAFMADMVKLYEALEIVTNNTSTSIGGGGTPRVPLAPAIGN